MFSHTIQHRSLASQTAKLWSLVSWFWTSSYTSVPWSSGNPNLTTTSLSSSAITLRDIYYKSAGLPQNNHRCKNTCSSCDTDRDVNTSWVVLGICNAVKPALLSWTDSDWKLLRSEYNLTFASDVITKGTRDLPFLWRTYVELMNLRKKHNRWVFVFFGLSQQRRHSFKNTVWSVMYYPLGIAELV